MLQLKNTVLRENVIIDILLCKEFIDHLFEDVYTTQQDSTGHPYVYAASVQ